MAQVYAEHGFWVWAALAAGLLAIEVMVGSGYLLWPSAAAAVVGLMVLAGLRPGLPAEVGAFAVLTIAGSLLAHRFFPPRPAEGAGINDPLTRLVGRQGRAIGDFRGGAGRVFVDGKEWAAELDGSEDPADGARIEVVSVRSGAALLVRSA